MCCSSCSRSRHAVPEAAKASQQRSLLDVGNEIAGQFDLDVLVDFSSFEAVDFSLKTPRFHYEEGLSLAKIINRLQSRAGCP